MSRGSNQQKNNKGQFLPKSIQPVLVEAISNEDYIQQVKNELYQLTFDPDKVKKAYKLITGIEDCPNVLIMKRIILAYTGN